jgi:hypothetical protein
MTRNVTTPLLESVCDTPACRVGHWIPRAGMRQSATPQRPGGKGIPGWVSGIEGLSRTAALRLVGNGVVPQQGAVALQMLLSIAARFPATACPGGDDQRAAA